MGDNICDKTQDSFHKHLACLTGEDARQVYRGASRMLVELARNKHPDIDAESMNEILKEGSNR